jgi:DNA-binding beta-propeller fold protein YncE
VDPRRGVVYSANSGAKTLTVHARGTAALLATLALGGRPHQMGLDPARPFLVVSNTRDETQTWISVVDADAFALAGNLAVTPLPHGVAVDPDRHVAYVSSVSDGTNAIVDLASGAAAGSLRTTDSASPNANMNAFSRRLRRLFVSDGARGGAVAVDVDTGASAGVIRFGAPAWGMQVDEATGLLYAALPGLDAIGVADAASAAPLGLIPVDGCPFAVRLDTARRLGFSTSMSQGRLTRFDLGRVEAALGRAPAR